MSKPLDPDTSLKLHQLIQAGRWSDKEIAVYLDINIAAVKRVRATRRASAHGGVQKIPPGPPCEVLHVAAEGWQSDARRASAKLAEALARIRTS